MNKIILGFILIFTTITFAQQLTYRSGGAVNISYNTHLNADEVREVLKDNEKALELYNAGRRRKTWGNVLFYDGLATIATSLIFFPPEYKTTYTLNGRNVNIQNISIYEYSNLKRNSTPPDYTTVIIGGVILLASIPVKIGFPKKIKQALSAYNNSLTDNSRTDKIKTTLFSSTNTVGFKIEF